MRAGQGALDHENRKTPISKPAANAQRPNVQAETTRTRLWRSASCGISWDRSVIATPLRRPLARLRLIGAQKKAIDDDQADRNPSRPRSLARLSSWSRGAGGFFMSGWATKKKVPRCVPVAWGILEPLVIA